MTYGIGRGVGSAARADLGVKVHKMTFDRRNRHTQFGGDRLVGQAGRDSSEYVDLARRESIGRDEPRDARW